MRIFISYSHKQGDWVLDRLVPCLWASGVEVLIDRERFRIGEGVVRQMDGLQDQADKHLLVLSQDYLDSPYCQHEMNRALKLDPDFKNGVILPVRRSTCTLPTPFAGWNAPLHARFEDDSRPEPWDALIRECGGKGLGVPAPGWLQARDQVLRHFERGESVDLRVRGTGNWRALLKHLRADHLKDLGIVNLEDGRTTTRDGLLRCICGSICIPTKIERCPNDLAHFTTIIEALPSAAIVVFAKFDLVSSRPYYDIDLFATLRDLITEKKKLIILTQSTIGFASLLPRDHPLSVIPMFAVEL